MAMMTPLGQIWRDDQLRRSSTLWRPTLEAIWYTETAFWMVWRAFKSNNLASKLGIFPNTSVFYSNFDPVKIQYEGIISSDRLQPCCCQPWRTFDGPKLLRNIKLDSKLCSFLYISVFNIYCDLVQFDMKGWSAKMASRHVVANPGGHLMG